MSVGINLEYYRRKAGLSQKQLSEKSGLSDTAIRKIRDGKTIPHRSTLKKLASSLGISIKDLEVSEHAVEVKFRKSEGLKTYEQGLITHLSIRKIDFIKSLYEKLNIQLPKLNKDALAKFNQIESIDQKAELIRNEYLKNNDLASFIEEMGAILIPIKAHHDFHGQCINISDDIHAIIYNANNTIERQIFTAIHELGHLLYSSAKITDEENTVNRLASRILLPEDELKLLWNGLQHLDSFDVINLIKRTYRISYMTVIRRLREMGVANNSWFKKHREDYYGRTGMRVAFEKEPFGLKQLDFFPKKLAEVLSSGVAECHITIEEANSILELA